MCHHGDISHDLMDSTIDETGTESPRLESKDFRYFTTQLLIKSAATVQRGAPETTYAYG